MFGTSYFGMSYFGVPYWSSTVAFVSINLDPYSTTMVAHS